MSVETLTPESGGPGPVAVWIERYSVSRTERLLWAVALVAMVADAALTTYGVSIGLRELNPIARQAFNSMGIVGFLWLKSSAIGIAVIGRWVAPSSHSDLIPATLAIPWVFASTLNVITILAVT